MLHIQPTSGHDVKFNLLKSKRKRFLLRRDTKLLTNRFWAPNICIVRRSSMVQIGGLQNRAGWGKIPLINAL